MGCQCEIEREGKRERIGADRVHGRGECVCVRNSVPADVSSKQAMQIPHTVTESRQKATSKRRLNVYPNLPYRLSEVQIYNPIHMP